MPTLLILLSLAAGVGSAPFLGCKVLDLTHLLDERTPYYPTYKDLAPFRLNHEQRGPLLGVPYVEWNSYCTYEHFGTHMDAPVHFMEHGKRTQEVGFENLMGEACVIDIEPKRQADPSYSLTKADVQEWEAKHGPVSGDCIVLLNTGQAKYYTDWHRYLNAQNYSDYNTYRFSSFTPEAAQYIVSAGARALGVDAISLDIGHTPDFGAHLAILGADIPGFENMNNLDKLPPRGSTVLVAPMLINKGSGAQVRAIALGWQENDRCFLQKRPSEITSSATSFGSSLAFILTTVFYSM